VWMFDHRFDVRDARHTSILILDSMDPEGELYAIFADCALILNKIWIDLMLTLRK
jgi:hypothetical protein